MPQIVEREVLDSEAATHRNKSFADIVSATVIDKREHAISGLYVRAPLTLDNLGCQFVQVDEARVAVLGLRQENAPAIQVNVEPAQAENFAPFSSP